MSYEFDFADIFAAWPELLQGLIKLFWWNSTTSGAPCPGIQRRRGLID